MGKYVEQHLHDDEFIIERVKFSRWKLTGLWVLAVLLYGATIASVFVLPMFFEKDNKMIWFICTGVVFFVNLLATWLAWNGRVTREENGNGKRWKDYKPLNLLRWLAFLFLTAATVGLFIAPMFISLPPITTVIFYGLIVVPFVAFLIPLFGEMILHTHREVVLTNKRIAMKRGVFDVECFDIPLDKVIESHVRIGFWGRIFAVQRLIITSENFGYEAPGVRNGYDFKNAVMAQIEEQQESRFARQATWTAQALAKNSDQMHAVGYGAYKGNQNAIGYREDVSFDYDD